MGQGATFPCDRQQTQKAFCSQSTLYPSLEERVVAAMGVHDEADVLILENQLLQARCSGEPQRQRTHSFSPNEARITRQNSLPTHGGLPSDLEAALLSQPAALMGPKIDLPSRHLFDTLQRLNLCEDMDEKMATAENTWARPGTPSSDLLSGFASQEGAETKDVMQSAKGMETPPSQSSLSLDGAADIDKIAEEGTPMTPWAHQAALGLLNGDLDELIKDEQFALRPTWGPSQCTTKQDVELGESLLDCSFGSDEVEGAWDIGEEEILLQKVNGAIRDSMLEDEVAEELMKGDRPQQKIFLPLALAFNKGIEDSEEHEKIEAISPIDKKDLSLKELHPFDDGSRDDWSLPAASVTETSRLECSGAHDTLLEMQRQLDDREDEKIDTSSPKDEEPSSMFDCTSEDCIIQATPAHARSCSTEDGEMLQRERFFTSSSGDDSSPQMVVLAVPTKLSDKPSEGSPRPSECSSESGSSISSSSSITTTSGVLSIWDDNIWADGLDELNPDMLLGLIDEKFDELMDLDEMDGKSRVPHVVASFERELAADHPDISAELKSDLSLHRFNLPRAKLLVLARLAQCIWVPDNPDFQISEDENRWNSTSELGNSDSESS